MAGVERGNAGERPTARTPRQSRAVARKAAAEHAQALANHYSPPSGGGQPHEIHLRRSHTVIDENPRPFDDGLTHATDLLNPSLPAPVEPRQPFSAKPSKHSLTHNLGLQTVSDAFHTQALRSRMALRMAMNGDVLGRESGAALHTHVKNGKVILPSDPKLRVQAAGLISPPSPGNLLQRVGFDALAMPTGFVDYAGEALTNPGKAGKDFAKDTAHYYGQLVRHPRQTIGEDPVMAALSVLPVAHFPGSVAGRAAEVGTAARIAGGGDATLADMYRHLPKHHASYAVEHGELPALTARQKSGMLARAILRSPHPVHRSIDVGNGLEVNPPASKSYTLGLLQKHVFDRWLQSHLNRGGQLTSDLGEGDILRVKDPLARLALGKAGRELRAQQRVRRDIQTAPLRRVEHFGQSTPARVVRAVLGKDLPALRKGNRGGRLSAAQEHAAAILARGLDPETVAKMHQNAIDRADELAAAEGMHPGQLRELHENKLHLTKIAAQYLEPGNVHPLVASAVDAMRSAAKARDRMLGVTEEQANHAAGSIWHAFNSRANDLPDLHAELESIEEHHGLPGDNARAELDSAIVDLHHRLAASGEPHAAELRQHLAQLHGLANDIEFKLHQIAQIDQAIESLGEEHYRGRMTAHPDNVAATHRELLARRSELGNQLKTLEAHARHRSIHATFVRKGAELRGTVPANAARDELIAAAEQRGVPAEEAAQTLDARALAWARETGGTTEDFYRQFAPHTELGTGEAGALHDIQPFHGFDEEANAARLRARLNPRSAESGLPANEPIQQGGIHVLGPITPAEWVTRVESVIPSAAERDTFARWYEAFEPLFREAFGDKADSHMRAFAVSQANASPSSGLQAVLRVADIVRQGGTVGPRDISVVGQSIERALRGHSVSKGVAAKLSDFIDSLRGADTRTWMGHVPEGGSPAAIDVHALRDLGYVDPKLVARLEARGLVHGRDFEVDNGGTAQGSRYEQGVRAYQAIADHLNEIGFDGRHDWTPAQAQALGWSAIQRFHGVEPENLQDAIDRNTYEIPYEVGNGMEGSQQLPADYRGALKATRAEEPVIRHIAEGEGATIRSVHYGPGGYEGDINAAGVVRVIASPEQADRIAQRIADEYKQWEVWATRPGVTGARSRAALEIGHESFKSKVQVEKFWRAFRDALPENLKDKAVGFTPIRYDADSWGLRIITGHRSFKISEGDKLIDRYASALEAAADKAGIEELGVRANNVEVRPHSGTNQTGPDAAAAAGELEGLGDRAAAEAPEGGTGEALHEQVAGEVRGAFNPESRVISLGEHATAQTVEHESLHAIRQSLAPDQLRGLEDLYGVHNGQWTRDAEEHFVSDMQAARRGDPVPPPVQSAYNASLVPPPEAFHLPFMFDRKPIGRVGQGLPRESPFGFGPASKPARHAFTGRILDTGAYRTNATALMAHSFAKAAHYESMTILHEMLLAVSKATQEEAGGASAVPIRTTKQIPDSLREEVYSLYPGDILQGEAVDDVASKLFQAWTKPPEHGEVVRWVNRDLVRPLEPRTMGAGVRWINNVNQAFRFGRYLSPAYIKWLPQNLVLHLVQAGPFVFRNAKAMMTELHNLDPEVYAEIANSVGFGSASALSDSSATALRASMRRVSHAWAQINDHIPRMLSFVHEAQREGFRTADDWTNLMRHPELRAQRDAIIRRANKEAIDYGAMTGRERQTLQALFAYWPWVRSASLYAMRFPFEHPYQAALYMQFARRGEQTIEKVFGEHHGVAPSYLEGSFPAKSGPVDLGWANPWEQLGEDAHALSGLFPGHPEELGAGLGTLSPLGKYAEEVISGRDAYGNPLKGGPLKGAGRDLAKRFGPVSIFQTATQPQSGAIPKGPLAAVEKFLGDPQLQGYDYDKGAQNALKDLANEPRERFKLEQAWQRFTPEERAQLLPQAKVALRVAQIRDSKSGTDKTRALELVAAAANGTSLADLNSVLVANKLKPFSAGDLQAEKARIRKISFP